MGIENTSGIQVKRATREALFAQAAIEMGLKADEDQGRADPAMRPDAERIIEESNLRGIQIQMGMGTAEQLSGGLGGGVLMAQAILRRHEAEEAEKKARAEDLILLDLLSELHELNARIDRLQEEIDAIDEQMDTLSEITRQLQAGEISVAEALQSQLVTDAVQRSGQSVDPDAPDSLDDLLSIIAGEQAGLAAQRSALADQMERDLERRADIVDQVRVIDADLAAGLVTVEEARADAEVITDQGYGDSRTVRIVTVTEAIETDAQGAQDGHSEVAFTGQEIDASSNSALDDMFGGTLAASSADFGQQFADNAAPPPETTDQPAPEVDLSAQFTPG